MEALDRLAEALPYGRRPSAEVVTGGQPDDHCMELARLGGVQVVVDLRAPGETAFDTRAASEGRGMRYLNIAVDGPSGITWDNARRLDEAISGKRALVFCGTSNRVGALFALRAALLGAPISDAVAEGQSHGMVSLRPLVIARLTAPR